MGTCVALKTAQNPALGIRIVHRGSCHIGHEGNPYPDKEWISEQLQIAPEHTGSALRVVYDQRSSSLLCEHDRGRALHVAWERNKPGDTIEIVDHYPRYHEGSAHSQQFVPNVDGTIALKSNPRLVLGVTDAPLAAGCCVLL